MLGLDENELAGFEPAYEPVTGRVIARSPSVDHRHGHGRRRLPGRGGGRRSRGRPDGLVGRVLDATSSSAQVELITDPRNAVSARVVPDGPQGIVEPVAGDPDDLRLDFVTNEEAVEEGQILVTAGWSDGEISSAYPYGIPIGEITDTTLGEQDFQRVTVEPFVDMRELQYVQVLTGGPERPGVNG